MQFRLVTTPEYREWVSAQDAKSRAQIEGSLMRLETEGVFGSYRHLGGHLWELKWRSGRRIYFSYLPAQRVLLLIGGDKNGQKKDINRAKRLFSTYVED